MPLMIALVRRVAKAYWTDAGRTAARNLAWLAVLTVVTRLCGLGSVLVLTSGLGQVTFGIFVTALSLKTYLVLLGSVGVNRITIRDGSQQLDMIETTRLVIIGVASVGLFVVSVLVVWWVPMSVAERTLIVLISAGNIAGCLNMRCLFDVQHQQPRSEAITLTTEVAALVAIFVLREFDRLSLPTVGVLFVAKWTFGCLGHFVVYHTTIRPWRWVASAGHIRQTLRSSWPLMLSALVGTVPLTSGIFFIRWHDDDNAVAIFGLAQQIAIAYMVSCAIGTRILQPHIAGPYGMTRSFVKKVILFFVLFHSAALAVAFGATTIIILWVLPPGFQAAVLPVAVLLVGRTVASAAAIAAMYAVTRYRETLLLRAQVLSAVLFAGSCLLLVPQGSCLAYAWVSLAASTCTFLVILWGVRGASRAPV